MTGYDTIEERLNRFQEITTTLRNTYESKNKDYGDSFHELYLETGIMSGLVQIAHKYNRLKNLIISKYKYSEYSQNHESLLDTLYDLANYCILTIMEIKRETHYNREE